MSDSAIFHFTQGYASIVEGLRTLGYATEHDKNFQDTREKSAHRLSEFILPKQDIEKNISLILEDTFPAQYQDIVISKNNMVFSLCPHDLLPSIYRISMAYIPKKDVLSIGKLSKIASIVARQPILQEQLTHNIAQILYNDLNSEGCAVYVEGFHLCMATRKGYSHDARIITHMFKGSLTETTTKNEFITLVNSPTQNFS